MNFNQYTIKAQEVIQHAAQMAQGNQQQAVETGHLLKSLLEEDPNTSTFLLNKLKVRPEAITPKLENIVNSYPRVSGNGQPYLGNEISNALQKAQSNRCRDFVRSHYTWPALTARLCAFYETCAGVTLHP